MAEIMKNNSKQGAVGELLYEAQSAIQGKEIERTGKGSDYAVIERDIFGEKTREDLEDVKTGNSTTSPLQKKKGAKVVKMETLGLEKDFPDELLKRPKKKSDSIFGDFF